eukprot:comp22475_c0_seq1/m.55584 comp22475_c0_seq1/g.55584  ORF comp22475_c0_seq1/g.55584 comp22475_c0_seq1/m.55584 type:complete len:374 (+) comp22475_c0_seq1:1405-2526(+)
MQPRMEIIAVDLRAVRRAVHGLAAQICNGPHARERMAARARCQRRRQPHVVDRRERHVKETRRKRKPLHHIGLHDVARVPAKKTADHVAKVAQRQPLGVEVGLPIDQAAVDAHIDVRGHKLENRGRLKRNAQTLVAAVVRARLARRGPNLVDGADAGLAELPECHAKRIAPGRQNCRQRRLLRERCVLPDDLDHKRRRLFKREHQLAREHHTPGPALVNEHGKLDVLDHKVGHHIDLVCKESELPGAVAAHDGHERIEAPGELALADGGQRAGEGARAQLQRVCAQCEALVEGHIQLRAKVVVVAQRTRDDAVRDALERRRNRGQPDAREHECHIGASDRAAQTDRRGAPGVGKERVADKHKAVALRARGVCQ